MSQTLQTVCALLVVLLALLWFIRRASTKKPGTPCGGCSCQKTSRLDS